MKKLFTIALLTVTLLATGITKTNLFFAIRLKTPNHPSENSHVLGKVSTYPIKEIAGYLLDKAPYAYGSCRKTVA